MKPTLRSSTNTMKLTTETLEHHWLPFTNNREFKREPRLFVRASGMYYWSQHGRKILDGSSGLFTSAAGHCAQRRQGPKLEAGWPQRSHQGGRIGRQR